MITQVAPKTPRKRVLLYCAVVVLICSVISIGVAYRVIEGFTEFVDAFVPAIYESKLQGLERELGVQFPVAASDIHNIVYAFWQSRIIAVRFRIPPGALRGFLTNLKFTGELMDGLNPFDGQELVSEAWWMPLKAGEYCGASFAQPWEFYDVLVDKTNPSMYIVYLLVEQG